MDRRKFARWWYTALNEKVKRQRQTLVYPNRKKAYTYLINKSLQRCGTRRGTKNLGDKEKEQAAPTHGQKLSGSSPSG